MTEKTKEVEERLEVRKEGRKEGMKRVGEEEARMDVSE